MSYIFRTITSVKIYKQAVLGQLPLKMVQKVPLTESEASTLLYTLLKMIGKIKQIKVSLIDIFYYFILILILLQVISLSIDYFNVSKYLSLYVLMLNLIWNTQSGKLSIYELLQEVDVTRGTKHIRLCQTRKGSRVAPSSSDYQHRGSSQAGLGRLTKHNDSL